MSVASQNVSHLEEHLKTAKPYVPEEQEKQEYCVALSGGVLGPVDMQSMRVLARSGVLTQSTLVWQVDSQSNTSASELHWLADALDDEEAPRSARASSDHESNTDGVINDAQQYRQEAEDLAVALRNILKDEQNRLHKHGTSSAHDSAQLLESFSEPKEVRPTTNLSHTDTSPPTSCPSLARESRQEYEDNPLVQVRTKRNSTRIGNIAPSTGSSDPLRGFKRVLAMRQHDERVDPEHLKAMVTSLNEVWLKRTGENLPLEHVERNTFRTTHSNKKLHLLCYGDTLFVRSGGGNQPLLEFLKRRHWCR